MKKLISMILTATLVCAVPFTLASCGSQGADSTESTEQAGDDVSTADVEGTSLSELVESGAFSTLADVFAVSSDTQMSTYSQEGYVIVLGLGDEWCRVEAAFADGMYDELDAAWTEDQDKVQELLEPLAVTKVEMIATPSAEEAEALVGKTGAELAADGFVFTTYSLVVNGDTTDCSATEGSFEYLLTFDGVVDDVDTEDVEAAVADLTVTEASFQGLSWNAVEGS